MRGIWIVICWISILCSKSSAQSDPLQSDIQLMFSESELISDVIQHLTDEGLSAVDARSIATSATEQLSGCLLLGSERMSDEIGVSVSDFVRGMTHGDREIIEKIGLNPSVVTRFFELIEPCLYDFSSATGYEVLSQ